MNRHINKQHKTKKKRNKQFILDRNEKEDGNWIYLPEDMSMK